VYGKERKIRTRNKMKENAVVEKNTNTRKLMTPKTSAIPLLQ